MTHRLRGTAQGERASSMSDPDSVRLLSTGHLIQQPHVGDLPRDRRDT
jgi:hypothetical protein